MVEVTREIAAEEDVVSQILWRRATARTAAQRGDRSAAEERAREAAELARATDFLDLRAGTMVVLGEVLGDAGRSAEATASLEEARLLYERKGNVAATGAITPSRPSVS